jgi:outer membrane protein assembly factor BamE
MVAQLKPGQTREQVRFILGTPLVVDIFHADRWDYVYRFQSGRDDQEFQQRRLVVYFEDGKLTRLDGDVVASRGEADAGSVVAKPATRVIDIKSAEGTAK